jgi:hypothetical protein
MADMTATIAEIIGEHLERMRAELEHRIDQRIAAKALPPFSPPAPWTPGWHGAGSTVRHANGIFSAKRDTEETPGDGDAWLPLVVGVRSLEIVNNGSGSLTIIAHLSDGTEVAAECGSLELDAPQWQLDNNGTLRDGQRAVGSIKPVLVDVLRELLPERDDGR